MTRSARILMLGALACACAVAVPAVQARVTRIVIDETVPLSAEASGGIAFEQVAGRAFGELDPRHPANALIQDIELAKSADGKVRYVATFVLTKPVDMARASGLMWHEVPNRGNRRPNVVQERAWGDIDLTSAWQGDNAGATAVRPTAAVSRPHWLQLPVARNADGSPVTGDVFGRIVNRSGPGSQPLIVQTNAVPYKPVSLDTRQSRLVMRSPGNNYGNGILPANPVPHTETVNALRVHFRNWVMHGTEPPPSRWPTLAPRPGEARGTLALAHKEAIGFPTLPQLRPTVPEPDFIMPVIDYDWGPDFNARDGSGIASKAPPAIRQVLPMYAPRVDADGNELGGVPVVLLEAPLGTYLGWNITAGGARPFHQGQICNYVGGMVPFARTAAERRANGDPRLSLEERYGTHEGYVAAVRKGAAKAMAEGFLLPADAQRLIEAAQASKVLR
jgi:hypothetical protein